MTDFTDAARRQEVVRLSDGSEWTIHLIPAGCDGWIDSVICAYGWTDNDLFWDLNGNALGHDANIVEIVEC
jgi:uncharacterized protein YfiM (DUF2279 family)